MASLIQRSLAAGEIGPELYARADQVKYQTGLAKCRNFRVMKHGGIENRSGTQWINEVKTSSLATFMIKFVFNADQTYVIEVGNQYFRFYRNKARIVVSGVPAWSNATNYVIGDLAERLGVNYYCIQAHINQQPPNAAFWYPLTGNIYEIPTPYVTADLSSLQFFQSGDVVRIVHPNYDPMKLSRTGHTTWTLAAISFAPSIAAPTGVTNSGAAGTTTEWVVTTVKAETYEESLQSSSTGSSAVPSSGSPITVSWNTVTGAQEYNVYKKINGVYGLIGVAGGLSFSDTGITPDTSLTPPLSRNPFSGSNNKPSTGGFYQQRAVFANTNSKPEGVWTSKTGMFDNLSISSPLQDDDAVTFSVVGKQVQEVRHLVEVGELVILTASGEYIVLGDSNGVLVANQPPNLKQIGYNGSSELPPIVIGQSLLFVQARGSVVRDLQNTQSGSNSNYSGRDITVFAPHLFDGFTIDRWDYAQIPHSTIWCKRSDGRLLGLTYLPEHEIWGWHRHDTDGTFEDVCCVPEGIEDGVYVIVNRTVNGVTKRYIERFASRRFTDIAVDALFMDAHLSYDGRNTTATTMTLSTGGGWTVNDTLAITASAGFFVSGDVGNAIVFTNGDDTVTVTITSFSSATDVQGLPDKTVPVSIRNTALTTWAKAVDDFAGLGHLEGKAVSILADGNVYASPNNPQYVDVTVSAATVHLTKPYSLVHIGLPFVSDAETLDLDIDGTDVRSKMKNITGIDLLIKDTRGLFGGAQAPADEETGGLDELRPVAMPNYGETWPLMNGKVEIPIASTWEATGKTFIRQVDPLPATILAAIPVGAIGG